jgi:peptidoglycan/LPS O-acetylase OafA/YrhL
MLQHSPSIRAVYSGEKFGWVGVDLFFVLSGYLITEILLNSKGEDHYYRNFFGRRALRIWPLYVGVVSVVIFIVPAVATPKFWPIEFSPIYYYFFLQNAFATKQFLPFLSPTWSLVVEEQFYLIWPFLVAIVPRAWFVRLCIGGLLLSPMLRLLTLRLGATGQIIESYTFTHMDGLLVGAVLAASGRDWVSRKWVGFAAVAGIVASALLFVEEVAHSSDVFASVFVYTALALGFGSILVLTFRSAACYGRLARLLGWRPLAYVGTISYGLYLLHELAQWAVIKSPLTRFLHPIREPFVRVMIGVTVEMIVACGVASLSWAFYERRFLKFKDRFGSKALSHSESAS